MPKRTNSFQKLVKLIERRLMDDATIEESKMVDGREVDVLIEVETGGTVFRVAVECRDHKRTQTVQWIEELIGKYSGFPLPIHKVFAVSASGFSSKAEMKAKRCAIDLNLFSLNQAERIPWGEFRLLKENVEISEIAFAPSRRVEALVSHGGFSKQIVLPGTGRQPTEVVSESVIGVKVKRPLNNFIISQFNNCRHIAPQLNDVHNDLMRQNGGLKEGHGYFSLEIPVSEKAILYSGKMKYSLNKLSYYMVYSVEKTRLTLGEALYRKARVFFGTAKPVGGEVTVAMIEKHGGGGINLSLAISGRNHDWTLEVSELPLSELGFDLTLFSFANEVVDFPEAYGEDL